MSIKAAVFISSLILVLSWTANALSEDELLEDLVTAEEGMQERFLYGRFWPLNIPIPRPGAAAACTVSKAICCKTTCGGACATGTLTAGMECAAVTTPVMPAGPGTPCRDSTTCAACATTTDAAVTCPTTACVAPVSPMTACPIA